MLPWFTNGAFPLYLAPMAGVTDVIFRDLCADLGADVMVTEFVSAEGVLQADARTRKYTEFTEKQRPVGVQMFGANPERMAEAGKRIIEWKQPDFLDVNFGCPVNKVVCGNGGSSLLKDVVLLERLAATIVNAVEIPVTAKIRIGWDGQTINATEVVRALEGAGVQAVAVHGRTRAQGYGGLADWDVIDQCAGSVSLPIIGNGDISSGRHVEERRRSTGVSGVMIGRAAMRYPWVFREARHYLETGEQLPPVPVPTRWRFMIRHCRLAVRSGRYGSELNAMRAMRARLMAYSRGFQGGKRLRPLLCRVGSVGEIEDIAGWYLEGIKGGNFPREKTSRKMRK